MNFTLNRQIELLKSIQREPSNVARFALAKLMGTNSEITTRISRWETA